MRRPALELIILIMTASAMPDPYYTSQPWPDHSVDGLKDLLGQGFVEPYKYDYFDCSEMSSFLQWKLQCHGFNAKMCQKIGDHAWVAVIIENQVYYLEPTIKDMLIAYPDPRYSEYAHPDRIFQNLSDALLHGVPVDEVDWWTVIKA